VDDQIRCMGATSDKLYGWGYVWGVRDLIKYEVWGKPRINYTVGVGVGVSCKVNDTRSMGCMWGNETVVWGGLVKNQCITLPKQGNKKGHEGVGLRINVLLCLNRATKKGTKHETWCCGQKRVWEGQGIPEPFPSQRTGQRGQLPLLHQEWNELPAGEQI
jgi:hypothetical protein